MEEITIILSAGHGGLDPVTGEYHCLKGGKSYQHKDGNYYHGDGWVYEGVLNREYCHQIESHAKAAGFKVAYVSHEYLDVHLRERANKGNEIAGKCVYLPVHFNASPNHDARGFEMFTTRGQNNSDELAEIIWGKMMTLKRAFPELLLRSDITDGDHDKEADFTEIKVTKHIAVYLEVLFFDSEDDIKLIANPDFKDIFCKYIVDAISLYYRKN